MRRAHDASFMQAYNTGTLVYADTPPLLVAIHPELLRTPGDVQAVAAHACKELTRRPIWVAVPPSPLKSGPDGLGALLLNDPSWHGDETSLAIVHEAIRRQGAELSLGDADEAQRVPRRSAIVPIDWDGDARTPVAQAADALGTKSVVLLAPRAQQPDWHIPGTQVRHVDPRAAPLRAS